ncbi:MAG TPA: arsenate reductase (glutaredoxin) [Woeseiaceae bacterium]|nr:arsenate reductase (glutaredoxin) [Woeseiaceae bacterium]
MSLTIYHNPRCSKSRQTLELIEQAGMQPDIVLYQSEPITAKRILELAEMLGVPVASITRTGESVFKEAHDQPDLDDDAALAAWIARHPIALERPIVVDEARSKAVLGRPPENVRALLPE